MAGDADSDAGSDDSEESDEPPDDLKDLSPEKQQLRIKLRAAWMCALGCVMVVVFSDPMVDVL